MFRRSGEGKWELLEKIWKDTDNPNPLYVAISNLRSLTTQDLVIFKNQRVRLNENIVWVDVWEFEDLVKRGLRDPDPVSAKEKLLSAVNIYRVDFFPHIQILEVESHRNYLISLLQQAYVKLASIALAWKDYNEAYQWSYKAISVDYLNEDAHRLYIISLIGLGHRGLALKQYNRLQRILKNELNVEPSDELKRVIKLIQNNEFKMVLNNV